MNTQRTALITGGATGIGLAIARRLAVGGAAVVLLGPDAAVGRSAEHELADQGFDTLFVEGDVTRAEQVAAAFSAAEQRFSGVDILVNNAALAANTRFMDSDHAAWRRIVDVTVDGAFYCAQAAALDDRARQRRLHRQHIVDQRAPRARLIESYNVGKGALDQLTRCLALELLRTASASTASRPASSKRRWPLSTGRASTKPSPSKRITSRAVVSRFSARACPTKVAAVVAFLVSDEASYITGAIVPVDGGLAVTF